LLLSRSGWKVTIVEQHVFPRDKVCGECLSAMGVEVLSRHGLLQPLLDLGATWLAVAQVHATEGPPLSIPLVRPMLGVSRWTLDAFLLDAAKHAGAEVLQPARCEAVESGDVVTARIRDLASNVVRDFSAPYVIIADGKSALLPEGTPTATKDLGIKSHWEAIEQPRDAVQLFGFEWGYGGFSPIENNRWNAAFAVRASHLRQHRGNIDALFEQTVREQPRLREKLAGARRVTNWLASPLPRFAVRSSWRAGVVPVGNAAAALEPIGGEGMGLALRSAELAADALGRSSAGVFRPEQLRREFKKIWRGPRCLCRAGALIASSSRLGPATFELLNSNLSLERALLYGLGK
jgi:flavin-dependent dehydrogenase